MTKDQIIERQIDKFTDVQRRNMLVSIACALWGDDADREWNAETTDAIAHVFTDDGIKPPDPDRCAGCQGEHDQCPLVEDCACCDNTRENA